MIFIYRVCHKARWMPIHENAHPRRRAEKKERKKKEGDHGAWVTVRSREEKLVVIPLFWCASCPHDDQRLGTREDLRASAPFSFDRAPNEISRMRNWQRWNGAATTTTAPPPWPSDFLSLRRPGKPHRLSLPLPSSEPFARGSSPGGWHSIMQRAWWHDG